VSDDNVSTVDIVPTLLGALGVEPPWSFDGIDLARDRRSDPEKTAQVVRPAGAGAGGRTLDLGEVVTFDGDEVLAEVLRRNVDVLLRDDNPTHRLYDIHDAGELVGRSVDDLEVVAPSGAEAELARPEAYEDVDRASGVLPTHFVADLDGVGDDPAIAVALNGRIAAVSAPWPVDGSWHLEAMLVPELVRDGRNVVELYVVSGPEGRRRLSPVEVTG
jgi:hypothetical protein